LLILKKFMTLKRTPIILPIILSIFQIVIILVNYSYSQEFRGVVVPDPKNNNEKIQIPRNETKAVLIANYTYKFKSKYSDLPNPPKDVRKIKSVLEEKYQFDEITIHENLDGDSLRNLFKSLSNFKGDLFVYYAGHGDTTRDEGVKGTSYIVPVDLDPNKAEELSLNYTYSTIIKNYYSRKLEEIPSKHFLFISDACYAGKDDIVASNFRSSTDTELEDLKTVYDGKAAVFFTSAVDKAVSDKSWFLETFLDVLNKTKKQWVRAKEIDGALFILKEDPKRRKELESQGYTMFDHKYKLISSSREGDFVFFKKNTSNASSNASNGNTTRGASSEDDMKNVKFCSFKSSFEGVSYSDGNFRDKWRTLEFQLKQKIANQSKINIEWNDEVNSEQKLMFFLNYIEKRIKIILVISDKLNQEKEISAFLELPKDCKPKLESIVDFFKSNQNFQQEIERKMFSLYMEAIAY
jgi:hypothetical protein